MKVIHKTKWTEIQHLTWRCDGCSFQCRAFGVKPKEKADCDCKRKTILDIVNGAELKV